ncbi:MAG: tRNA (guanosine(37)-N1)-methyltransferase TrmD [Gammaproteobacteria bacterium]|nr:tRNA (guanosine(37)-N1)-methyltransferase TrmD [Gammaproteobacteria bacterium]
MLQLGVISVMPDMFTSLQYGVTGRALAEKRVQVTHWNPRDWTQLPHRQVDDKPYGGGPGMVMRYEPLHKAILEGQRTLGKPCKTVYLSPQGTQVKQAYLKQLVDQREPILFVAGRYEGIDERILIDDIDEEWSLGDFVLSGGEFAAMVFIDALARLLPGSLGHPNSAQEDSFMTGLLDHPHYTRPPNVDGREVPHVLLQGDHSAIEKWRRKQALGQTWLKRPDLLSQGVLTNADEQLLIEFKHEYGMSLNTDSPLEE